MSKRAEEYANAQYPQMWVSKAPTSCEKVDYNERTRCAARIAYEQAEKDTIELAKLWVDSGDANVMSFKQFLERKLEEE